MCVVISCVELLIFVCVCVCVCVVCVCLCMCVVICALLCGRTVAIYIFSQIATGGYQITTCIMN